MRARTTPAPPLPIDGLLPRLVEGLAAHQALVLSAPPGAGKSTRVAPALAAAGFAAQGQLLLLQPRRVAARAVARRMAEELGCALGERVGYQVRHERRASAATEILVVTEGLLTRRLVADPLLSGTSVVLLDEAHERSLDGDLALAMCRESLTARPELRLVVMSATLAAERFAAFLGGCPILTLEERGHPLQVQYLDAARTAAGPAGTGWSRRADPAAARHGLGAAVAAGLRLLAAEGDGGDVLVFLPGAPEIAQVAGALADADAGFELVELHGGLPPGAQDRALRPGSRRRVVLATNLAETSLTVPGVSAVIDSGLVKRLRYDPSVGFDRLVLERVSQASATQRAGRAGRLGPGRVVRLWSAAEQRGLLADEPPEIARVDLAPALLAIMAHGSDPASFPLLSAPPPGALAAALATLRQLGAVQADAPRLTALGERLAALPLHPRLGAMLLAAEAIGPRSARVALAAASILSGRELLAAGERGTPPAPPDHDCDLSLRLELFGEALDQAHPAARARHLGLDEAALAEARRVFYQLNALIDTRQTVPIAPGSTLAPTASVAPMARPSRLQASPGHPAHTRVPSLPTDARQDRNSTFQLAAGPPADGGPAALRAVLLAGYADRVCCRREPGSAAGRMVGGRGVELAPWSGVRRPALFIALRAEAGRRGLHASSLVTLAAGLDVADLEACAPEHLGEQVSARYDEQRQAVIGLRERRFFDLPLSVQEGVAVDEGLAATALAAAAAPRLDELLAQARRGDEQERARLALAARLWPRLAWPAVDVVSLAALLPALCRGRRTLAELARLAWAAELIATLPARQRALLDAQLPLRWRAPSGRSFPIDYAAAIDAGATSGRAEPSLAPGARASAAAVARASGGAAVPRRGPVLAIKLQELFGLWETPAVAEGRLPLTLHLLAPNGRPAQVTDDLPGFWRGSYAQVRRELRGRYPKHDWPETPPGPGLRSAPGAGPRRPRPGPARALARPQRRR